MGVVSRSTGERGVLAVALVELPQATPDDDGLIDREEDQ